jgi:hypothetical protein
MSLHTVASWAASSKRFPSTSAVADRLLGDGLVPLHSALGQHDDGQRQLYFAHGHQYIAYRTSHLQLLSDPAITRKVLRWLT